METSHFALYLISLLCSLYTIDGKVSDKTVIQSYACNAVNFNKSNALNLH